MEFTTFTSRKVSTRSMPRPIFGSDTLSSQQIYNRLTTRCIQHGVDIRVYLIILDVEPRYTNIFL